MQKEVRTCTFVLSVIYIYIYILHVNAHNTVTRTSVYTINPAYVRVRMQEKKYHYTQRSMSRKKEGRKKEKKQGKGTKKRPVHRNESLRYANTYAKA